MINKIGDFAIGSFIVFYVAMSHFVEVHTLCVLAVVVGFFMMARGLFGDVSIKALSGRITALFSKA